MIGTTTSRPQRFLAQLLILSGLLLGGCGSSGGGGPSSASPVIVAAAFIGGSTTPASGDLLVLVFSAEVVLSTATFSDADVTLSGGGSLGTITQALDRSSTNTVRITLGNGVSFTPGTTTIALSVDNDVIGGTATAPTGGGDPVTIGDSDGSAPTISNVTVANVDDEMNGTGAAGGTLQVPTNGWTIDLAYSDNSAIATAQTVITANVSVTAGGGTRLPGTNLRQYLTEVSATNTAASYSVPVTVGFPQGAIQLSCLVVDISGLTSTATTFTVQVRPFSEALRPFETNVNANQTWYLDFTRDVESYTGSTGGVAITNGANGTADFEDLLEVLGMITSSPTAGEAGARQAAIDKIKANMLTNLAAYYSGANVTFTLTQPAGTFPAPPSPAYSSFGYSQISIAGSADTDPDTGILGLAIFDPNNTTQNDNTQTDFSGNRLGVFLHTIINSGLRQTASDPFRLDFDPFTPVYSGTPIGESSQDTARINETVGDGRETQIQTALSDLAMFLSTVTAHECGHSVGLVQNGAMPTGLYGDDSTNFPGSSNGHIRNLSLFPMTATNIMSPSLSYRTATDAATAFNTLNLAYLREQVFYGN